MNSKLRLFPYKQGSTSAKLLARGLGILRIKQTGSRYVPKDSHRIINWGSTSMPEYSKGTIINSPRAIALATNKLHTFRRLTDVGLIVPDYKVYQEDAEFWVSQGHTVYGRQTLTGSQGQGIVIFNEDNPVVTSCPLYTKATKAKIEYRVHVVEGKVIDFVQKKKRLDFEGGIRGIRNHANGWVFARTDVILPNTVKEQAILAVKALGLHFGAVDIGYIFETNKAFIYEVNTAPGLEGTTLAKYIQAFKESYYEV